MVSTLRSEWSSFIFFHGGGATGAWKSGESTHLSRIERNWNVNFCSRCRNFYLQHAWIFCGKFLKTVSLRTWNHRVDCIDNSFKFILRLSQRSLTFLIGTLSRASRNLNLLFGRRNITILFWWPFHVFKLLLIIFNLNF